tara:strand:+ start:8398 stop:9249 length:852 start_codon:yes stop_codon:yes gene_type:complete
MAQLTINTGTEANTGGGDPLRTAFTKVNDNFTDVYAKLVALEDGTVVTSINGSVFAEDSTLLVDGINAKVVGPVDTTIVIGGNVQLDNTGITTVDSTELVINNDTRILSGLTIDNELSVLNDLTLGVHASNNDDVVPLIKIDKFYNSIQNQIPPTNIVDGAVVQTVYSKRISRFTSGGEILLTLLSQDRDLNSGVDYFVTKKFLFSYPGSTGEFRVIEIGSIDNPDSTANQIFTSLSVRTRLDGTALFLEIIITAPDNGLDFIRAVGQITYTSIPLFLTVSGY